MHRKSGIECAKRGSKHPQRKYAHNFKQQTASFKGYKLPLTCVRERFALFLFHFLLLQFILSQYELPGGQIMSQTCDKVNCNSGRAGFSRSLPLSLCALIAAADLSFPRGLRERTEMWCCCTDTSHGSQSAAVMLYSPPPSLFFVFSKETPGARRCVTAVSGMLGGRSGHFPGLQLHLRLSDTGTRISGSSGRAAQHNTEHHS